MQPKSKSISEITEQLEQGIAELFASEKFKNYLDTMGKFHNYSLNNTVLIFMQNPDARLVAGFQSWKKNFERHVKAGEKGMKILAPTPWKKKVLQEQTDKDGKRILDQRGKPLMEEVEITVPAFKVTTVFDISQTEGKELPSIVNELEGTVENFSDFLSALNKISPVPIRFEEMHGKNGFYNFVEQYIGIRQGMSEQQTMKTGIHELSHAILHTKDNPEASGKNRSVKEVEAESVAYVVCQHYGIDTSDYSFGYVAGWSSGKEVRELKASLEIIRKTASDIITSMDDYMKELQIERENSKNVPVTDRNMATITCEWSEHQAFEGGKTYSVYEFDELMRKSDREWCEGQKQELEKYGSFEAAIESGKSLYQGYAKVKFTINMPEGFAPNYITERLDVGDGMGGVIDYYKSLPQYQYGGIVKVLEISKEKHMMQQKTDKITRKPSVLNQLHKNQDKINSVTSSKEVSQKQREGGIEK